MGGGGGLLEVDMQALDESPPSSRAGRGPEVPQEEAWRLLWDDCWGNFRQKVVRYSSTDCKIPGNRQEGWGWPPRPTIWCTRALVVMRWWCAYTAVVAVSGGDAMVVCIEWNCRLSEACLILTFRW